MNILAEALYFILPAYGANMAPVLFRRIPVGNFPISEKLFGSHKTYRGFFSGILIGIATLFFQRAISDFAVSLELISYGDLSILQTFLIGISFGGGALGGDLLKSFFKRRLKIPEGKPWIPFDQLDFVIGAFIAVSWFFLPSISHLLVIFLVTPILHLFVNIAGFTMGLKKVWW